MTVVKGIYGLMDTPVSCERLARLWDRYVELRKRYVQVKEATDAAEAACEAAHDRCEALYAEEIRCGLEVMRVSKEFCAAADAAFLHEIGISSADLNERNVD